MTKREPCEIVDDPTGERVCITHDLCLFFGEDCSPLNPPIPKSEREQLRALLKAEKKGD